ncbi:MAG: hypothetical protein QM668_08535 [Agriterribacter sp.]
MKKVIIVFLLVISFEQSFCQAGTVTLAVALKQLSSELSQAIENAKNAGLNLEIEAGREVALSIESFKNAYSSSLDLTINKLDPLIRKQWESIKGLTNQIQSQTVASLNDVAMQTQQIVDALPFRSHQPHLRSFTPAFIVPSQHNYEVVVRCKGNFEDIGDKDYRASLQLGGHIYPNGGTNQEPEFHIPIAEFMKSTNVEKYKFGYVKCIISFPWKDKYFHLFPKKSIDTYSLYIGMLPLQPGRIILTQKITTPNILYQTHVSTPPHRQSSCSDGGNIDKKDVPYVETPEAGWTVVRGTSKFNEINPQGDRGVRFMSDDGNRVQYNVSTYHHGITGGPSGCLDFTISFTETKEDLKVSYSDIPFDINWGDSKTIDIAVGEWKITFTAFDGSVNEFKGVDNTNPFIQIIEVGGVNKIITANPGKLEWH